MTGFFHAHTDDCYGEIDGRRVAICPFSRDHRGRVGGWPAKALDPDPLHVPEPDRRPDPEPDRSGWVVLYAVAAILVALIVVGIWWLVTARPAA